jgi:hypothetical protein
MIAARRANGLNLRKFRLIRRNVSRKLKRKPSRIFPSDVIVAAGLAVRNLVRFQEIPRIRIAARPIESVWPHANEANNVCLRKANALIHLIVRDVQFDRRRQAIEFTAQAHR